ncbi:MAG: permease [Spirochaetaceae bacterium]
MFSNLIASLAGALMYFATRTEVPIMQGLLGAGMNQGAALALLLAAPSLSLPALPHGSRRRAWYQKDRDLHRPRGDNVHRGGDDLQEPRGVRDA